MDSRAILAELPRLRRYARALVGDRAAADDLVQDTLERAWSRFAQWRPDSNLRAWLLTIMHHLRADQLRRRPPPFTAGDVREDDMPSRPTQTDRLELAELAAAIAQLPEEQRAVLLLVALEEMPYAEIAGTLAIPIGTVMSRLSRARDHLRRILDGRAGNTCLRVVQ
ncbi:MAG: sigma-70 family RNA polymerase sigma factor [Candidatus Accumulibacter sp.]|nr:sigma-70 family RNA polymerase sigma factor [Accumulibacter sp.]